jgi:predicted nucleic acid-binding Zn finger protein
MAKTTQKTKLTRTAKAQQLFNAGVRPVTVCNGLWTVPGSQGEYEVTKDSNGAFNCSCPDSLYRSHQGESCKHVLLIIMSEAADSKATKAYNELEAHLDIHLHKNRVVVF